MMGLGYILFWMLFFFLIIYLFFKYFAEYSLWGIISGKLFGDMKDEGIKICPKCGSQDWKFASPLMATDSMVNIYYQVNNFIECRDCGYIGIFFVMEKEMIPELKKVEQLQETPVKPKNNIAIWIINIYTILSFIVISTVSGELLGLAAAWGLAKHLRNKVRKNELSASTKKKNAT
jgi:hypothetical protein